MKKSTKVWLLIAACLVLVGSLLFVGVMTMLKWDFSKLSTVRYVTNTYTVTDGFTHISVAADTTADVTFAVSQDDTVSVVCYEREKDTHTVSVDADTLRIDCRDERRWYQPIGIDFHTPKITVYLPADAYGSLTVRTDTGDVSVPADFTFGSVDIAVSTGRVTCSASTEQKMKIKTSTGDIRVSHVSVGSLDLTVSTGHISVSSVTCDGDIRVGVSTGKTDLSQITCRNLTSDGSTGDVLLRDVVAAETFSIERSTGDVHFDACDAATLTVTTDTGDIRGTLLTEKVFVAHTDTGRVSVPETATGGKCQLTTDTGDIKIAIP